MAECTTVERNANIVSDVMRKLKVADIQVLDKNEIFRIATSIQDELLSELHCKEVAIIINTIAGKGEYDYPDESTLLIKNIFTSWEEDLELSDYWELDSLLTGTFPTHYIIFDGKFRLPVNQVNDNDTIEIWAFQESTINPIDDVVEPEIPNYLDSLLILGICNEYAPERFAQEYLMKKDSYKGRIHNKTTKKRKVSGAW